MTWGEGQTACSFITSCILAHEFISFYTNHKDRLLIIKATKNNIDIYYCYRKSGFSVKSGELMVLIKVQHFDYAF